MTKCQVCAFDSWLVDQFDECPNCLGWDHKNEESDQ
jgi:hypothetical protein